MCHPATAILIWFVGSVGAQVHNWTETQNETIWRIRYTNCDKGYAVDLPPGVVAHGSLPPNPNHGFLISADDPHTTAKVGVENQRVVDVYDQFDAMELGSARAYLDWELKSIPNKEALRIREFGFQGLRAVDAGFRVSAGNFSEVREELIAFRKGLIYVLMLRTTAQSYASDSALFAQIRAGFHLLPLPTGACSNP